jgi:hypothetical protein
MIQWVGSTRVYHCSGASALMLGNGVSSLRHEVMGRRGWLWILSGSKISILKQFMEFMAWQVIL